MPIKGACVVAGIGVTTLAEWREKHPEIEQRIDEARELARQQALQRIKAAGEKDWRTHAEWLRLTFPGDYRDNANEVEVQQSVQVQISRERLADIRSRLEHARAWVRSRDTSPLGGTRKNEEEIDVQQLNAVSVIPVAAYAQEAFSDKFGHSNCVIPRGSCKVSILCKCR